MPPTVIFGDIRQLDLDEIRPILDKYGIRRLDSAAGYEKGDSERRLGQSGWSKDFAVDTKILHDKFENGPLSPEKVDDSSRQSLERLKLDQVNVLYCHGPDFKTPVEDQARGFDEVYKKGRFKELGLSNLNPDMVEDWIRMSKEKNYVKPTWFQGQYNLVCRANEDVLFPLLRKEGVRFAAYAPVAGGFLNGNLRPEKRTGVRFTNHSAKVLSLGWFDRPIMHETYDKLLELSKKTGIPTDELGVRWLMHHSALQDDDVVILGASKAHHIENTMANLRKGPLDDAVVKELNALRTDDVKAIDHELVDPTYFKFG